MKCSLTQDFKVSECFEKYNTIRYMSYYVMAVFIFSGLIANFVHIPNDFGLAEILVYIFIPSAIGSLLILLVKWKFQPVIKLVSSFMFGGGYMTGTSIAFGLAYFFQTQA